MPGKYFLNMALLPVFPIVSIVSLIIIITVFLFVSLVEGFFTFAYLRIKKISVPLMIIFETTIKINLFTTLLGGIFLLFFPQGIMVILTFLLWLVLSIILEQLALARIIKNKRIYLLDREKYYWYNAVALGNLISYTFISFYLLVRSNEIFSPEIYYPLYAGLYFWGIILFITGIGYSLYLARFDLYRRLSSIVGPTILAIFLFNSFFFFSSPGLIVPRELFPNVFTLTFTIILLLLTFLSFKAIIELTNNNDHEYFIINLIVNKILNAFKISISYQWKKICKRIAMSIPFISIIIFLPLSVILSPPSFWDPSKSVHTVLTVGINHNFETWDIRQLDYHDPSYQAHRLVMQQVYGYLGILAPGNSTKVLPGVAETWEINTDGSITFTLRENAYFHNGDTIRARDVEYSWKMGFLTAGKLTSIDDLNWTNYWQFTYPEDDPTGQGRIFTVKEQTGNLNAEEILLEVSGANPIYALIPEGHDMRNNAVMPISCGPFVFNESYSKYQVRLVRFDDWYGWGEEFNSQFNSSGSSYIFPSLSNSWDTIVFTMYELKSILMIWFFEKELDLVIISDYIADKDYLIEAINTDGLSIKEINTNYGVYLGFNIQGEHPEMFNGSGNYPLTRSWFRRTISLAINSTALQAISSFNTSGLKAFSSFLPVTIQETINGESPVSQIHYNKSKAIELLENHGYYPLNFTEEENNRFGFGSFLNETQGNNKGKHFLLGINTDNEKAIGELIQKDLQEIGIYVDLVEFQDNVWRRKTPGSKYNPIYTNETDPKFHSPAVDFCLTERDFWLTTSETFLEDFSFDYWWIEGEWCYNGGWNDSYYEQSVLALRSLDWTESINNYERIIHDLNDHLAQEVPQVPLFWKPSFVFYNEHLSNLHLSLTGDFCAAYTYWKY